MKINDHALLAEDKKHQSDVLKYERNVSNLSFGHRDWCAITPSATCYDLTCNPVSTGRHLLAIGKSDEAITESGESWFPFNVNRWQTYSPTCTLKQKMVS